ncbi:MAG: hypothetical protein AJITA_01343 [Acetilactobacillus jinshanensis]
MTNSTLNCNLKVEVKNGNSFRFGAKQLHQILDSLTHNAEIINRAGVLILAQLTSYRLIKLYDLKCLIYRTLKQLSYKRIAHRYYEEQLA